MNDEPAAPRKFDPLIPLDLETIILKAIEKDPRDRYQTALAMGQDIRSFLNDEPIAARRVRPVERMMRWQRRNRGLAIALSAVAALLLMLFGLLSWTSIRQRELLQLAESRGDTLLHNLYFSQMNVAGQAAAQEFGTDAIRSQLSEWDPAVVGKDFRNWEWYYLYGLSHDAEFVSERLGNGFCWACDHSPDGSLIVNTKNGWGVQVRDSKTGDLIAVNELGSARFVDWSPDGEKIAVGHFGDTCYVLDAETLETITEIVIPDAGETWCVHWHPNSRWLAEVSENKDSEKKREVRIHDIVTGRQLYALKHPEMVPRFLSWHPDGTKLAASGGDKASVWRFTEGQPELELELRGYWATWSPDGSMLAISRPGGIWDALSDRLLAESLGSIAWSSDSRRLAIGCDDGTVRIHDLQRDGAIAERFFRGHESEIWSVSWHPNGRALASCGLRDETLRIFNLGESDNVEFSNGQASVHLPEFTPRGTQVVFSVFYNKAVFVYDLARETSTRKSFPVPIGRVAPSPDGTTIAVSTERPSLILWNVNEDSLEETETEHQFFDLAWNQRGELAGITTAGDIVVRGADGTVLHKLPGAHSVGGSIHWSPDGRKVASIGSGNTIKLWDVASETLLWQVTGLTNQGYTVRFSHDGNRLATSHREALMIWDVRSGEKLATLDQIRENFVSLDWSPDGSRIVSGSNSSVAVWDVAAGRVTIRLDAPNRLFTVRWSDDGKRILAGGNTIILYDASRGYSLNESSPDR